MKFGIALGALNAHFHFDVVDAAESLGYESVWLPEHLVFPIVMSRSPRPGEEHPPVPPTTPVFDAFTYLAFLAARTSRLRLGTHVYNVGLRHPFVSARAVATLDIVSGGRFEFGIGASWLEQEWIAAGLDFATRGTACRRLDRGGPYVRVRRGSDRAAARVARRGRTGGGIVPGLSRRSRRDAWGCCPVGRARRDAPHRVSVAAFARGRRVTPPFRRPRPLVQGGGGAGRRGEPRSREWCREIGTPRA